LLLEGCGVALGLSIGAGIVCGVGSVEEGAGLEEQTGALGAYR
jgi:hypothetical protein